MSDYRLFGLEMSPYSVKVRSYLRYKKIPHQWIVRSMDQMPEFGKYAKLPLVPCVACPDGTGLQDSTPIMEKLEAQFPEPSTHPEDGTLDFLSALIEEYADEWCNKFMFHYRWYYDNDAKSAALRIARETAPAGAPEQAVQQMGDMMEKRMVPRLSFVGSGRGNTDNASLIERSFERVARILDGHLAHRAYLFGGRPVMADFSVYGQFKEAASDPTPGLWMRTNAPHLVAYVERMEDPVALGDIEPMIDLMPGLGRLLREDVGACFLPWSDANAEAVKKGETSFTVAIDGVEFTQEPQKYHAKSLQEIRRKYAQASGNTTLNAVLADSGCLRWLEG